MRMSAVSSAAAMASKIKMLSRFLVLSVFVSALIACSNASNNRAERGAKLSDLNPKASSIADSINPTFRPLTTEELRDEYRGLLSTVDEAELKRQIQMRLADLELRHNEDLLVEGDERTSFDEAVSLYKELIPQATSESEKTRLQYQLSKAYSLAGLNEDANVILDSLAEEYTEQDSESAGLVNVPVEDVQQQMAVESYFRLAETAFNQGDFRRAKLQYERVIKNSPSDFEQNAYYMLGWTEFKLNRYDDALIAFIEVLDQLMPPGSDLEALSKSEQNLVSDSLRAMSIGFSYLGGGESILETLNEVGDRHYADMLFRELGGLYRSQSRYVDAAETYLSFVSYSALSPDAPEFSALAIQTYYQGNFPSLILPAKEDFVAGYSINSQYWLAQKESDLEKLKPWLFEYLTELSSHYHAQAQAFLAIQENINEDLDSSSVEGSDSGNDSQYSEIDSRASFLQAADYYDQFVRIFPNERKTLELAFLKGEALYEAEQYSESADAYEFVAYELQESHESLYENEDARWIAANASLSNAFGSGSEPDSVSDTLEIPSFTPLEDRMKRYLSAWSDGDLESYVSFYSPNKSPVLNLSYDDWYVNRAERIYPDREIKVLVEDLLIQYVSETEAVLEFTQYYSSINYSDTALKQMRWYKDQGIWYINEESEVNLEERDETDYANEASYNLILAIDQVLMGLSEFSLDTESISLREAWINRKLESIILFADHYPQDDRAPPAVNQAMDIRFENEQYEDAIVLAQRLSNWLPLLSNELIEHAALVEARSEFLLERYELAEQGYRRLLAMLPSDDELISEIEEQIAASLYRQAEGLIASDEPLLAVDRFIATADFLPNSEIGQIARFDAANQLMSLESWQLSIEQFLIFANQYSGHDLIKEIPAKLAFLYQQTEQWELAADNILTKIDSAITSGARGDAFDSDNPVFSEEEIAQSVYLAAQYYQEAEASAKAKQTYQRYIQNHPNPRLLNLEAHYQLTLMASGSEYDELIDSIVLKTSVANSNTRRPFDDLSDREAYLGAMAANEQADETFKIYQNRTLTLPLAQSLRAKQEAMGNTLNAYTLVLNYSVSDFSTLANYRMAEVYVELSQAVMDSQRPGDLDLLALEQYEILLEEQAFPFEEKAIELHEANAKRSWSGDYDSWVQESFISLSKLLPGRYNKSEKRVEVSLGIH